MKEYCAKKLMLSLAIVILMSSQAIAVTAQTTKDYKSKYRLSDKHSQEQVIEIVDYFSKNYPYNKQQIEKHFQVHLKEFVMTDAPEQSKIDFLWHVIPKHRLVENVYLSRTKDKQQLNLALSKPICYHETFVDNLRKQHYTGLVYPPIGMFAKMMDSDKQLGTVRLYYEMGNLENTICITNMMFDTEHPFDIKDYKGITIIPPDMPLP